MNEKNDQQLVSDYLNGVSGAFSELLNRHLKPIYNFVYRLTGDRSGAEDIAQETFFKAWRSLKKYKPEKSFKTWLFTIARNTATDWLRKKKNLVFSDFENEEGENALTETLADPEPLPDEILARAEDAKFLEKLLERLSVESGEILLLHYHERLTFDEIGKILGKPLNTVKSRHRRALIELRKIVFKNASNKAEVMRKALLLLAEEEAVSAVLKSEQEAKEGKILRGDLRNLARKIP